MNSPLLHLNASVDRVITDEDLDRAVVEARAMVNVIEALRALPPTRRAAVLIAAAVLHLPEKAGDL